MSFRLDESRKENYIGLKMNGNENKDKVEILGLDKYNLDPKIESELRKSLKGHPLEDELMKLHFYLISIVKIRDAKLAFDEFNALAKVSKCISLIIDGINHKLYKILPEINDQSRIIKISEIMGKEDDGTYRMCNSFQFDKYATILGMEIISTYEDALKSVTDKFFELTGGKDPESSQSKEDTDSKPFSKFSINTRYYLYATVLLKNEYFDADLRPDIFEAKKLFEELTVEHDDKSWTDKMSLIDILVKERTDIDLRKTELSITDFRSRILWHLKFLIDFVTRNKSAFQDILVNWKLQDYGNSKGYID